MPRLAHHGTRDQNADHWQRLVQDYRDSSLSQRAFCAERGLALSSFTKWHRRLSGQPADALVEHLAQQNEDNGFVAVRVRPATSSASPLVAPLCIELPSGVRIENIDAHNIAVVAALVAAL